MSDQTALATERLFLRPFNMADASTVQRHAGMKILSDMTEAIPYPYLDGMAEEWIATHATAWKAKTSVTYAVCEDLDGGVVGCIGLQISKQHNRASLGYWFGVDFWGKGYCTEAASAVLNFAFTSLELNRIDAIHLSHNLASGAVMKKMGMLHEGTHRQYVIKNGHFHDVETYAILAADYIENT